MHELISEVMSKIASSVVCPRCGGDGEEVGAPMDPFEVALCDLCKGSGEVPKEVADKYLAEQEEEED
jgi:DnaJ-class molecular chaperone